MKQSQHLELANLRDRICHAQLVIKGQTFELSENISIVGRMGSTNEQKPHIDLKHLAQSQTISREHLQIEWDGEHHYLRCIKDFPNKVYLNNQELSLNDPVLLMHGDIIVFGDILARFECLLSELRLPEPDRPYARLRWLGMGATFYVQKNPGFIGRGRNKYFPNDLLAFDFESESRDVLCLSRPHAKLWMENDGRVYIKTLKSEALVWVDGERVTDTVEIKSDVNLKLARLLFQIQLLA